MGTYFFSKLFRGHEIDFNPRIVDFDMDTLVLDDVACTAIGPSGRFAADDGRFYSAADASAGHDADDRVVYDSSSGRLYYDADGFRGPRLGARLQKSVLCPCFREAGRSDSSRARGALFPLKRAGWARRC